MEHSRVGRFFLSDAFTADDGAMGAIRKLMADVFITSATYNWGYRTFEYMGISKHFDIVPEAGIAPIYIIECSTSPIDDECIFVRTEDR